MFSAFLDSLHFALGITAPIFLLVILGVVLKRSGLLDDNFLSAASRLVFTVCLPTLLFVNIVETHLSDLLNIDLIAVGILTTLALFIGLLFVVPLFVSANRDRGVVIQGAFRGNLGIVGLAFCISAYGDAGLGLTAIYMAVITVLYNILAVIVLTKTLSDTGTKAMGRTIVISIFKNPIVIAIMLALFIAALSIRLPAVLLDTGNYISRMTLPLALICIGGSISLKELRRSSSTSVLAVVLKLVISPLIGIGIAIAFKLPPMELGIVFLMSASPAATASYIMVQAMKGNGTLAANIVVLSTLASVITVSAGIVILRNYELI